MFGHGETEGKVAQLATNHFTKTWLNFMNKSPKSMLGNFTRLL